MSQTFEINTTYDVNDYDNKLVNFGPELSLSYQLLYPNHKQSFSIPPLLQIQKRERLFYSWVNSQFLPVITKQDLGWTAMDAVWLDEKLDPIIEEDGWSEG